MPSRVGPVYPCRRLAITAARRVCGALGRPSRDSPTLLLAVHDHHRTPAPAYANRGRRFRLLAGRSCWCSAHRRRNRWCAPDGGEGAADHHRGCRARPVRVESRRGARLGEIAPRGTRLIVPAGSVVGGHRVAHHGHPGPGMSVRRRSCAIPSKYGGFRTSRSGSHSRFPRSGRRDVTDLAAKNVGVVPRYTSRSRSTRRASLHLGRGRPTSSGPGSPSDPVPTLGGVSPPSAGQRVPTNSVERVLVSLHVRLIRPSKLRSDAPRHRVAS